MKDARQVKHRKLTPDYQMTRDGMTPSASETAANIRRSVSDACIRLDKRPQVQFSGITEASEDAASEAAPAPPGDQVEQVEVASPPVVRESSKEVTKTRQSHIKSASAPSSPSANNQWLAFPFPSKDDDSTANLTGFKRLT